MYILALETTGAHASAAIIDEKGQVLEKKSQGVLNHLQYLMPMVKELLEECELQLSDITAVAASRGPGSFTGIRIGVSSARALAQVLKAETIAVPTLKAFAYNMPQHDGLICPVFDARRNQVYAGAYRWEGEEIREIVKGAPYSIDEFLQKVRAAGGEPRDGESGAKGGEDGQSPGKPLFFGDGTKAYGDWFREEEIAPREVRLQTAASVAKLALSMKREGLVQDYEELKPDYMRKAEAERKLEQHE